MADRVKIQQAALDNKIPELILGKNRIMPRVAAGREA